MANNFDENTMNNIKKMVDSGNLSGAISQIPPEMIENFSKMMNSNSNSYKQNISTNTQSNNVNFQSNNIDSSNSNNKTNSNFDFSNIDMNTIMKMKSIMENMNNKNDPSHNLLYSLKPYLRESKQEKLDQYANLLNISKIAEAFNNTPKI